MRKGRFITVNATPALSGFFAIMMGWSIDEDFGGFWEPYETGIGRYATKEEAIKEGKLWAEELDIEFRSDELY